MDRRLPLGGQDGRQTGRSLRDCVGPSTAVSIFYSDNAPELVRAAKDLKWHHDTATPGRPQTNGVAERTVKQVEEGARTICEHAGLEPQWWPRAVKHFCFFPLYTSDASDEKRSDSRDRLHVTQHMKNRIDRVHTKDTGK